MVLVDNLFNFPDSTHEIFPCKKPEIRNSEKSLAACYKADVVNEDEGMLNDENNNNDFGLSQDFYSSMELSNKSKFIHYRYIN